MAKSTQILSFHQINKEKKLNGLPWPFLDACSRLGSGFALPQILVDPAHMLYQANGCQRQEENTIASGNL
jgi:hypothetical protein